MAITHNKVSGKADKGDTSLVLPSDWNDDHIISDTIVFPSNVANHQVGRVLAPAYFRIEPSYFSTSWVLLCSSI